MPPCLDELIIALPGIKKCYRCPWTKCNLCGLHTEPLPYRDARANLPEVWRKPGCSCAERRGRHSLQSACEFAGQFAKTGVFPPGRPEAAPYRGHASRPGNCTRLNVGDGVPDIPAAHAKGFIPPPANPKPPRKERRPQRSVRHYYFICVLLIVSTAQWTHFALFSAFLCSSPRSCRQAI